MLKKFTYDPDAVYDDAWLRDTLYDSAIGAALGGLGGAVDVAAGWGKADTDTQSLTKQENPVPNPEAEQKPVRVGRVTTIRNPYTGKTPVQTQKSEVKPVVAADTNTETRRRLLRGAGAFCCCRRDNIIKWKFGML